MFDWGGVAGAFPVYGQQLKQGAFCLVFGRKAGFLPPVRQDYSRLLDDFPIPPLTGPVN